MAIKIKRKSADRRGIPHIQRPFCYLRIPPQSRRNEEVQLTWLFGVDASERKEAETLVRVFNQKGLRQPVRAG
jgi:hypothetical protein